MVYKVELTAKAEDDLRQIVHYLLYDLNSYQSATRVADDIEDAIDRLAQLAGSLKLCEAPELHNLGYRTIHLKYHRYFLLYHIEDDKAYVDGIYHDLQDYENYLHQHDNFAI